MWRCILVSVLPVCALLASPLLAHPPTSTARYPRVYGATGRPYGPTQAHYQYQRRYGRSWHGYGGLASYPVTSYPLRGYYPSHALGWGFQVGPFGSACGYGPWLARSWPVNITSPLVLPPYPDTRRASPEVYNNGALRDAWLENQDRWQSPLDARRFPKIAPKVVTPSTADATMRSVRAQGRGDDWFRQQRYTQAHERYEHAISLAQDRAEPWFRKAFALAALGQFHPAARAMRRGLKIDPDWPSRGESLDNLFGRENVLAKTSLMHRVSSWVHADIRDPDRLFLMGVLLHFDDQRDKSPVFFDAALRLAGHGDHLVAFLQPTQLDPLGQPAPGPAKGGAPNLPEEPPAPAGQPLQTPRSPPGFQLPLPPMPSETPPRPDDSDANPPVSVEPGAVQSGPTLLAPGL